MPMPKVEVESAGTLSLPVPDSQIATVIRQAERAPYGQGNKTLVDTAVRKVWQIAPSRVRIGGKSWAANFETILLRMSAGLECDGMAISAEFYKLLVYDRDGFFLPHRDTEKTEGMFGTLVVTLPSAHRGGELRIRHAGREVTVDTSSAEFSDVFYVAFYADCEHEALPVREGNRVCLVYNLVQKRGKGRNRILKAPEYETQIAEAAAILDRFLRASDASAKIAWLLEHQYSPAGLSFSALKVADAARAGVFMRAASRARCAAHLGIVHIEESGTAEPDPGNTSTNGETRRMSTWISARFLWVMAVALNEDPLRCFLEVAAAAIDGLDRIGTRDRASEVNDWEPEDRRRPISPQFLVNLLQALRRFKKATLCDAAAEKIAARPELFKPVTLVVPDARTDLCDMGNQSRRADSSIVHLWTNSTRSLLQRSEFPPEAAG